MDIVKENIFTTFSVCSFIFWALNMLKGKFLAAEKFALLPALKRRQQEARPAAVRRGFLLGAGGRADEPLLKGI
jgi:hypothetical protein